MNSLALLVALPLLAIQPKADSTSPDNTLSAAEKAAGFELLFNGKDLEGWRNNNGKPVKTGVEDGAIQTYKCGGYVLMHEREFGDFILRCDVKLSKPKTNSGIFIRMSNPKSPVQNGFEIQVMGGSGTGRHDLGAIYDLVAPSKNMGRPVGEWNSIEIKCQGPNISVRVNGEKVSEIDLDDYTEAKKRPDGSKHKFGDIRKLPRVGHLGFQDHGSKVWFKNVRVKDLQK
ncbi:MAG: 3-keto-disaccharide hydrolase [Verrucomicrobiales bacterium]